MKLSSLWKQGSVTNSMLHTPAVAYQLNGLLLPHVQDLYLPHLPTALNTYKNSQEGNFKAAFYRPDSSNAMIGVLPQLTIWVIG